MTTETFFAALEIKEARRKLNVTQEELAQLLGVSYGTVNRWENGKSRMSLVYGAKLAALLNPSRRPVPSGASATRNVAQATADSSEQASNADEVPRFLRIAVVQIEFEPVRRTVDGTWRLGEPLAPRDPLADFQSPHASLSALSSANVKLRDEMNSTLFDARGAYEKSLAAKLRDIMTFCFKNGVDMVVFPEYSIPLSAVPALRAFGGRTAIVAGLGYLQRSDIETLRQMKVEVTGIAQGSNVALILSPSRDFLVAKTHPAEGEQMQPGAGPECVALEMPKGTFNVGIAVCLDFLREDDALIKQNPDLVAIPALSSNTSEFYRQSPRNFLRVFANHSYYGGSYIGAPTIKGMKFADQNGTTPLPASSEGIVIVDWDFRHPYQEKPTRAPGPDHRLYARAALLYKGRDDDVAQAAAHLDTPLGEELRIGDLIKVGSELRTAMERSGRNNLLLSEAIQTIEDGAETLLEDELRAMTRHCVLNADVYSVGEWRYLQAVRAAQCLKRLQDEIPEQVSGPFALYETIAREEARNTRSKLVESRHKGPIVSDEEHEITQLVLFASLGNYGEKAAGSFKRQLTLLRTLAELRNPQIKLAYRLRTIRDKDDRLAALWDILCTATGCNQDEIERLRESIGQLIHTTFTGIYSMSYTLNDSELREAREEIAASQPWSCEIRQSRDKEGRPIPFAGFTDWGLIIDFVRSLEQTLVLELQCVPLDADQQIQFETSNVTSSPRPLMGDDWADIPEAGNQLLDSLPLEGPSDLRRLQLRIVLGSSKPLPKAVIDCIGVELGGGAPFEVTELESREGLTREADYLSPFDALRVFHPPFGSTYPSSGRGRRFLNLFVDETRFPPTGIVLGQAGIRHVRSDEELEVRLSEKDRLRHLYILGRTGSGKTNLLKRLASQDVKIPGRGVTIVDPHGDLVDHVIREIPEERLHEVVLIDLARTDALPVLNPLAIDRTDTIRRDRVIQELMGLLRTKVFHQYTGPRFEELVRLTLDTMLDPGYPVPASLTEIGRILMDSDIHKKLRLLVTNEELRERWQFQETMKRDPEYGGLIHYVTSRFDDIARDRTLSCVLGGKDATVNIESIVASNGILLVRIPEAVIGKDSSDFIGSLILQGLRLAIVRRRESGETQRYHFVYVDEFQNFANTDFHTIVAEARKFNMGFTLANQNLQQLREFRTYTGVHEERLIGAILGNVAHLVAFSMGARDASELSPYFGIDADDIMRIGRYQALAKVVVDGYETRAFTLRGDEEVSRENPRALQTIEDRMKAGVWVDPERVLQEIGTRIQRLKDSPTSDPRVGESETPSKLAALLEERQRRRKAEA